MEYAGVSEAPAHMHFWVAMSVLAGALGRKTWLSMGTWNWYCNFFIILVAPPGVVSKSTTLDIGMNILKQVPDVKFGPSIVTWPALVSCFADTKMGFEHDAKVYTHSSLNIVSSEFGNFLNPSDTNMVDLLVNLYDCKDKVDKVTKGSGKDDIENVWVNIAACTTPAWIAGNFPEYMIGGGFTSRCLFVYADEKEKYVAYPFLHMRPDHVEFKQKLLEDLTHISKAIIGPYQMSKAAIDWGEKYYRYMADNRPENLDDDRFQGYLSRKQSHIHKAAMAIAASRSDEMILTDVHFEIAASVLATLEGDMPKVFRRIGKNETSLAVDRLVNYVHKRRIVSYSDLYRYIHSSFPSMRDFEDVVAGCVKAGYIKLQYVDKDKPPMVAAGIPLDSVKENVIKFKIEAR